MPVEIDKVRFFQLGSQAPKNSRFKGIITQDTLFGKGGWLQYTQRDEATQPDKEYYAERDDGFFGYTFRQEAVDGLTMTSMGDFSVDNISTFAEACKSSFKKNGDIVWDMVISLPSYDYAEKCGLHSQKDYATMISKIMPEFFRKIGLRPSNMLWWENYHKNTEHPHMHVCYLEKNKTRDRGKLTLSETFEYDKRGRAAYIQ